MFSCMVLMLGGLASQRKRLLGEDTPSPWMTWSPRLVSLGDVNHATRTSKSLSPSSTRAPQAAASLAAVLNSQVFPSVSSYPLSSFLLCRFLLRDFLTIASTPSPATQRANSGEILIKAAPHGSLPSPPRGSRIETVRLLDAYHSFLASLRLQAQPSTTKHKLTCRRQHKLRDVWPKGPVEIPLGCAIFSWRQIGVTFGKDENAYRRGCTTGE